MQTIKILTLTVLTVLIMSVSAFAGMWSHGGPGFPSNWDNFTAKKGVNHYLSGSTDLGGFWDVSFIYKEAGHTDTWTAITGETLSNQGTPGDTVYGVGLLGSVFRDLADKQSFGVDSGAVKVYEVIKAFSVGGVSFLSGDLLLAFNDAWGGDRDYDDLILKATPTATPIPGAAWLLGTGLLGLVGLKRRIRA